MEELNKNKLTEEDLAILLKELDIGAIIKESLLDEAIFGESIIHINNEGIRRINPLSDEAKELMYNCKIEYLTREEIKNKNGK